MPRLAPRHRHLSPPSACAAPASAAFRLQAAIVRRQSWQPAPRGPLPQARSAPVQVHLALVFHLQAGPRPSGPPPACHGWRQRHGRRCGHEQRSGDPTRHTSPSASRFAFGEGRMVNGPSRSNPRWHPGDALMEDTRLVGGGSTPTTTVVAVRSWCALLPPEAADLCELLGQVLGVRSTFTKSSWPWSQDSPRPQGQVGSWSLTTEPS